MEMIGGFLTKMTLKGRSSKSLKVPGAATKNQTGQLSPDPDCTAWLPAASGAFKGKVIRLPPE